MTNLPSTSPIMLRSLSWPDDQAQLVAMDTSFTTDRIYRLKLTGFALQLDVSDISPPIAKSYSMNSVAEDLSGCDWVQVAEQDGKLIGVAALAIHTWNRRAELRHLYVARKARRNSVGRSLMTTALAAAQARYARCLWVETQTVNYGAVGFYLSCGFTWCGLDASLYDPARIPHDEIAIFFSRQL